MRIAILTLSTTLASTGCSDTKRRGTEVSDLENRIVIFTAVSQNFRDLVGIVIGEFVLTFGGASGTALPFALESDAADPDQDRLHSGTMDLAQTGVCRFDFDDAPGSPSDRTLSCDLVRERLGGGGKLTRLRLRDDREPDPTGATAFGIFDDPASFP